MIRRPPRSTRKESSAASDVYKRQPSVIKILKNLKKRIFLDLKFHDIPNTCLLYTSPSPRDVEESRMPSSA